MRKDQHPNKLKTKVKDTEEHDTDTACFPICWLGHVWEVKDHASNLDLKQVLRRFEFNFSILMPLLSVCKSLTLERAEEEWGETSW